MVLRVVFMGTPEFAVPTLARIAGAGHEVVAVYTRAPKPAGRGMAASPTPVERFARGLGLRVETPRTLKGEGEAAKLAAFAPDVAVVVAYGLILPQAILDAARLGCLNLHASLLPRWRGAAPIARAIMAGDRETGVMVMRMEAGLDTGPVGLAERVTIGADETAQDLAERLAPLGADLVLRALDELERGSLAFASQPSEGVTYAEKIAKAEARIDWSRPARAVHDQIRGLSPFPGAWFQTSGPKGERVKVVRSTLAQGAAAPGTVLDGAPAVACGEGAVRLVELQRAGAKPMGAEAFLRGFPLPPGTRLA